jgi:molybdopterin-biosynthesis enzyme MoeA-like protein
VISRNVRVDGSGEGVIAEPLERVAKAHPDLSLGSYPFFGPEGYGSNLVVRGREVGELEATVLELVEALKAAGIGKISVDGG